MKAALFAHSHKYIDGKWELITLTRIFIHPDDNHRLADAAREKLASAFPGKSLVLELDKTTIPWTQYVAQQGKNK